MKSLLAALSPLSPSEPLSLRRLSPPSQLPLCALCSGRLPSRPRLSTLSLALSPSVPFLPKALSCEAAARSTPLVIGPIRCDQQTRLTAPKAPSCVSNGR